VKIVIFGSRNFDNYELLKKVCDRIIKKLKPDTVTIISGTARGADTLGERYANERGYDLERYPAEWDRYGKSAGYRRNEKMAKIADVGIGFWDGRSKGTKHMIDIMKKLNKKVYIKKFRQDRFGGGPTTSLPPLPPPSLHQ